ncbi:hypothetical protein FSARC_11605 [Fusarium sarcochroum]|uniref:Uncharacterized protein n=1 Tax=Fusarium sarcochroum TaxID=1208366 RepID=A0A8H4WZM6_9HYPO|nr:hypothetical protein FSARC_11605 [Fusarium sarcochroum]
MSDPSPSACMTIPLKDFSTFDANTEFAQDLGPCDSRPSEKHFRILVFPHQASQPEFCWAFVNEKSELVVSHSSIDNWKTQMKDRYEKSDKDPLIVHALSRDYAMEGKIFGHGIRVASWQPANGPIGHLEGFNETIVSLAGTLSSRIYGPLVAFAYNLDSDFNYESMDMSTNDFRHLVDFFHNSDWNPTINNVARYPKKAISGLFIPDPCIPAEAGNHVHDTGAPRGLPVNRRWENSYSRLLCQGVRLGHKSMTIDLLRKSDGIVVFNAFGAKMDPLHLLACDEFMYRNQQSDQSQRVCTKEEFLKFWTELKEGKTKILHQKKEHQDLDFSQAESPHHTTVDAQPVFAEDASQAFLYLRELFQDQEFRRQIHGYEVSLIFDKILQTVRWGIGMKFWQNHLNELYFGLIRGPPAKEKEGGKEDEASQATLETGNALAELAQVSLNMMEK